MIDRHAASSRSVIGPGRWLRRAVTAAAGASYGLLPPLLGPLVALAVIRTGGPGLWGEFVAMLIVVQLGAQVAGWGNKEYLLRRFGRAPAHLAPTWRDNVSIRAILWPVCAGSAFLAAPSLALGWLAMLWGLGLVVHQSFDALVTYRRDFRFALAVEVGGVALVLATVLALGGGLTVATVVTLFAILPWGKAALQAARHRRLLREARRRPWRTFDGTHLTGAWPFLVLGLSGWCQSRADLYVAAVWLPPVDLARYQVFMAFMVYLQSVGAVALSPHVRTLYRLPLETLLRLARAIAAAGLVVATAGVAGVALVLTRVYGFEVSGLLLLAGTLCVLPTYAYLALVYTMYKLDRAPAVLTVNALGIVVSLAGAALLLPHWGTAGGVAAAALAQWAMLAAYLVKVRSLRRTVAVARADRTRR